MSEKFCNLSSEEVREFLKKEDKYRHAVSTYLTYFKKKDSEGTIFSPTYDDLNSMEKYRVICTVEEIVESIGYSKLRAERDFYIKRVEFLEGIIPKFIRGKVEEGKLMYKKYKEKVLTDTGVHIPK